MAMMQDITDENNVEIIISEGKISPVVKVKIKWNRPAVNNINSGYVDFQWIRKSFTNYPKAATQIQNFRASFYETRTLGKHFSGVKFIYFIKNPIKINFFLRNDQHKVQFLF